MRDVLRAGSFAAAAFLGFTMAATSAPPGLLFLCPTPAAAAGFWKDIIGVVDRGVEMNQSIAFQIAEQYRCWPETHKWRPIAMQAGTMRIGNGDTNDGYVTPDYYMYVQFLTYGLRP